MVGEFIDFPRLLVKRLDEDAIIPEYETPGSIGLDLRAHIKDRNGTPYETCLVPGSRKIIETGLAFAIPLGFYGRIAPRSGLAANKGIDVLAGVVDSDYRGEIKVILLNTSQDNFRIKHGDRIAQIILEKASQAHITEVQGSLDPTTRGSGGFGSTGVS